MYEASGIPSSEENALAFMASLPGGNDMWAEKKMQDLSGDIVPFSAEDMKENGGAYDLGELEQPLNFGLDEEPDLDALADGANGILSGVRFDHTSRHWGAMNNGGPHPIRTAVALQQGSAVNSPSSAHTLATSTDSPSQYVRQRPPSYDSPTRSGYGASVSGAGRHDSWGPLHDAGSPQTDTSTEMDADVKVEHYISGGASGSGGGKEIEDKALRRLAQNREAARKSRLRKKAYVQQLESSRIRLQQLEQELVRARQQARTAGMMNQENFLQGVPINGNNGLNPGAAAFDMDYGRWVEEHHRFMGDLRGALNSRLPDTEVRLLVDGMVGHYEELFRLKSQAAKADVFHLVSGMWKTPAERCFMWMGGFRPSELLKILIPQIEPLTEQQLLNVCNLQQSSQQAEDTLTQGLEALQQSLADTLSAGSLGSSTNVANYMGQMAMAMGKLGTLESFVRQADSLRLQTLQQMNRILQTRQTARGLLAMGDYFARLRALSSLWSARPRE